MGKNQGIYNNYVISNDQFLKFNLNEKKKSELEIGTREK